MTVPSEFHLPFLIDGNTQMDSFFAGNFSQDGLSWGTACVLEDLEVNANSVGSAIRIWNTTRYLVINNCSVINSLGQHEAGIELNNCTNVNITNCHVYNNEHGIYFDRVDRCAVVNNNISLNLYGVLTDQSDYITFSFNNFSRSGFVGCEIGYESVQNNVTFNRFFDNEHYGLTLSYCDDCLVQDNEFSNNTEAGINNFWGNSNRIFSNNITQPINEAGIHIIGIGCNISSNLMYGTGLVMEGFLNPYMNSHFISTSNKANGKSIYYYVNKANLVPANFSNPGQILLVNCTNASIHGLEISNTTIAVGIMYSNFTTAFGNNLNNNRIGLAVAYLSQHNNINSNNVSSNHQFGIEAYASFNNTIENNTLVANENVGLVLRASRDNLSERNNISGGMYGIALDGNNRNNTFFRNDVFGNLYGCYVDVSSSYNTIYLNRFSGNTATQAYSRNETTRWDNGTAGNFWGDYTTRYGSATNDNNTWNTQYLVNGTVAGYDRYPLVYPFIFDLLPKANFTANMTSIVAGQRVQFNFTGFEGRPTATFQWNFGDGGSNQTERDPSHVFINVQNCTVTLTVNDSRGHVSVFSVADYITVEADLPTSATFNQDRTYIIAGQSVQFSFTGLLGNVPTVLTWDFGDATPVSHATNPSHQYGSSGNYTVSLTVTDKNGNSSVVIIPSLIHVDTDLTPVVDFITNGSAIVEGQTVQFFFTGSLGNLNASIEWDFGDASSNSSLVNPSHLYIAAGNYTIRVRIVDFDNDMIFFTRSNLIRVQLDILPTATCVVNSSDLVAGQSARFTFTGLEGNYNATFEWNFGDSTPVSTERNPAHRYVEPGNFTVSLQLRDFNNDVVSNASVYLISVEQNLLPVASFYPSSTNAAAGSSIAFTFTGSGGNEPFDLFWDFGDGSSVENGLNPNHEYEFAGTYVVTLTVVDRDGSEAQYTTGITVSLNGPGVTDPFLLIIITLLVIGSALAVIVPVSYKRARRTRVRREPDRVMPGKPFVASISSSTAGDATMVQLTSMVTVFSREMIERINSLHLDNEAREEILSILKNIQPSERQGVLDGMLSEVRDFSEDF